VGAGICVEAMKSVAGKGSVEAKDKTLPVLTKAIVAE
jgi:hypothetical protein